MNQAPLRPTPLFLPKPWGGCYLSQLFAGAPEGTGEAWLASDLPGEKGTLVKGIPLAQLVPTRLPLVKLLDSTQNLSVQVHPDDAVARHLHGPGFRGKWETWLVLRAPATGTLLVGLEQDVGPADLLATVRAGRNPEDLLRPLHVEAGDSVAIPPGTVHALTQGTVVVELQTPVDLTYRLYDWGRVGADGKPRELHLEYAQAALAKAPPPPTVVRPRPLAGDPGRRPLAGCGPLHFEHLDGSAGPVLIAAEVTADPVVLVGLEGQCEVRSRARGWPPERLAVGECLVVPPGAGELLVGGMGCAVLGSMRP